MRSNFTSSVCLKTSPGFQVKTHREVEMGCIYTNKEITPNQYGLNYPDTRLLRKVTPSLGLFSDLRLAEGKSSQQEALQRKFSTGRAPY